MRELLGQDLVHGTLKHPQVSSGRCCAAQILGTLVRQFLNLCSEMFCTTYDNRTTHSTKRYIKQAGYEARISCNTNFFFQPLKSTATSFPILSSEMRPSSAGAATIKTLSPVEMT